MEHETSEALESSETSVMDELEKLKKRVSELEDREKELLKVKEESEKDFGQKRAKFKELFIQKEDELKSAREEKEKAEEEMAKVKEEMARVSAELEGVRTAAAVSENNKQDEINQLRLNYQQELASLQHILREASDEASKLTAAQYETERNKLVSLTENLEQEIQELRTKLSHERSGEGFLSTVAKSLKLVGGSSAQSALDQEHENLEDSMRRAQADAEILKSVVMPLEEEIDSLKNQLGEANARIRELESKRQEMEGTLLDSVKSPSLPDLDGIKDPEEKITKLMKYLKDEKAARTDLEMYVAVLSTQKKVLQEDSDKLRKELHEVCRLLEDEKQSHEMLKQTWQMANDQFLESQRLLMMDMRRMESVLTQEQQRQIVEVQKKDLEREAQQKKVKELEEMREKQEKEQAERRKHSLSKSETNQTQDSDRDRTSSLTKSQSDSSARGAAGDSLPVDVSGDTRKSPSGSMTNLEERFLDSGMHELHSPSEVDGMHIRISPDRVLNLPTLTEAQLKAITDPTPETEARRSLMAIAKMKPESMSLEGKRLVSDKEWKLMQEEIKAARDKLGKPCDMCANYEAQLQGVQEELREARSGVQRVERQLNAEKQTLAQQQKYCGEIEEALNVSSKEAASQVSSLTTKLAECEKYIRELKTMTVQSQLQLQDELKTLTESRETVQKELTRLQDENDKLVGKHSKTAQQLQNEDINLPNNLEEMQLLLLKYREEIIEAKVAKEHIDETLRSEILFLKDQVLSEQQEKATIEETLSKEISDLQERLAIFESIKSELERESCVRAEAETRLRETEANLKSTQAKSKQLITALQAKLDEHVKSKTQADEDIGALRAKIQSLQVDLDNSEAVQRDFVKLSQSLQIQLERIRQGENEVRWQHEEDVDECTNCRQSFAVTRRKHHCRHCGKIFCADCTSKQVFSGPHNRSSRVCDVCHTILVKDATPYFSTEPPSTPD